METRGVVSRTASETPTGTTHHREAVGERDDDSGAEPLSDSPDAAVMPR